eukprot:668436-Hanusia_phi.AAC.1
MAASSLMSDGHREADRRLSSVTAHGVTAGAARRLPTRAGRRRHGRRVTGCGRAASPVNNTGKPQ